MVATVVLTLVIIYGFGTPGDAGEQFAANDKPDAPQPATRELPGEVPSPTPNSATPPTVDTGSPNSATGDEQSVPTPPAATVPAGLDRPNNADAGPNSVPADSPPAAEYTPEALTTAYKGATFTLIQDEGLGTGLLIGNNTRMGLIVTNQHVVEDADSVFVKPANVELVHLGHVIATHAERDLALIQINYEFKEPWTVGIASLPSIRQGQAASAFGSPRGIEFLTVPGVISRLDGNGTIFHSCELDHGNSGGPLVLNRGAYVAGINVRIGARTLNCAEPAEAILGWRDGSDLATSVFHRTADVWDWKIEGADRQAAVELLDTISLID